MNIRIQNEIGVIIIRDFIFSDIPNKIKWINNPENNLYLHYDLPLEYNKTVEWYYTKNNNIRKDCIIEVNNNPVGLIGLLNIDNINKKAEFYITLGEPSYKRKGISTVATQAMIDYAFNELKLHKVYLNTDYDNIAAQKLFEKVGFICEGIFIDDLMYRGKFINRIRYAILSDRKKVREHFNSQCWYQK